jgi:hypothetical protein
MYPFWFWNGVQDEANISAQLAAMKDGGCRGVVLHSRTGNRIPYLSERWMALLRHSCECCRRLGLAVWLYDEDGYPSGNAGMMVQKLRPDLRQKHLVFDYSATDPAHPCHAAYDPDTYEPIDETAVPAGTVALRFSVEHIDRHVDVFSRESADLFISLTHDKFQKHLGEFFGNVIEAIYTDNESYQVWNGYGIAWSETLEAEYAARFGAPLTSILPRLVEDLPGAAEARFRFHSLARDLFLRNFIVPQVEWCRRNGLLYTGHLCGDEGPTSNCIKNFGTAIPYFMEQDIPALDDYLCDIANHAYLREPCSPPGRRVLCDYQDNLLTHLMYKGASSVSNQFKSGLVSCEALTFLGWNVTPDFLNTQMMFELGMGVNLMTPHAYYYTVGDGTKHDCPPSYSHQQPFHRVFGERSRAWTRTAELLMRGKFHADTLVIYPDRVLGTQTGADMDASFVLRRPRARMSPAEFDIRFSTLLLELARRHVGYELGEDSIVARLGRIEGGTLALGAMAYSTVVVMPGIDIGDGTAALLRRLEAAGGRILTLPPGDASALDSLAPDIDITGAGTAEILVHARDNAGFREAYLLNLSGKALQPRIAVDGDFILYDPVADCGFHASGSTPEGFEMEHGAACMVMPPDFACKLVDHGTTQHVGARSWTQVSPRRIKALRDNIAAFPKTADATFAVEPGAQVRAVYAERIAESGMRINGAAMPDGRGIAHHPCDFCFTGVAVSGLCHDGANEISFDKKCDMVYLEGDFAFEDGVLKAPKTPVPGDLAKNGFPHYWGAVEYEFAFDGVKDMLRLDLAGGAAEVFVNDRPAGVVFGLPPVLRLGGLCKAGENTLVVRLYNTAANFLTAKPEPFGLRSAWVSGGRLPKTAAGGVCQKSDGPIRHCLCQAH